MARPKNPKRDEALKIWLNSNGSKKLKDIATELEVSDSQIRKWKNQDNWEAALNSNVTKPEGNVTKRGAPVGNKNAIGNDGGSAPKQNKNAIKHGFFAKYLPQESLDIIEELQELSPVDILWQQINIQYAAIIRAQPIMFVTNKDDMTKELKREKRSSSDKGSSQEEEYEIQFSWDKQATFLNAQARAMSELRSLIKDFLLLSGQDDERRLRLEGMRLNIEKSKRELNTEDTTESKLSTYIDKLSEAMRDSNQ